MNSTGPAPEVTQSPVVLPTEQDRETLLVMAMRCVPDRLATVHVSQQRDDLPERLLLVDIDGTISDPTHRRHLLEGGTPDWVRFSRLLNLDPPRSEFIERLRRLHMAHTVVLCSGRPSCALDDTVVWLDQNAVPYDFIAIRPAGDRVRGIEHKLRLLGALKEASLTVHAIIDDDEEVRAAFSLYGVSAIDPQ